MHAQFLKENENKTIMLKKVLQKYVGRTTGQ